MRLLSVERSINIYNKDEDDNEVLEEIVLDISIEQLLSIVSPNEDDPLLYDGYELDLYQLQKISGLLPNKIIPHFDNHIYVLECVGIYDWGQRKSEENLPKHL